MKTVKISILISAIAIALASCSKDGAAGPAGASGSNGKNGTNGTNGVANISSVIYPLTAASWAANGTGLYKVIIADTAISNVTLDGIEVFCEIATGNFMALPSPNVLNWGDQVYFETRASTLEVLYAFTSAPGIATNFKVVVIPPAIKKLHPTTNWKDYNQVRAIIGE